jgi:hypothetical protein
VGNSLPFFENRESAPWWARVAWRRCCV